MKPQKYNSIKILYRIMFLRVVVLKNSEIDIAIAF